jgi:hypothetical protein
MPQAMTGVLILIASPGDTYEERLAVSQALMDWNVTRGRRDGVALLPWLYEKHAVPRMGGRPQEIINEQAVTKSDIVVAFFDSRLGTSTGVDVSGTAEEINSAVDAGKPVHVFFSEEDLPRDVDPEQLIALTEFQTDLESRGLLGRYSDPADLVGQVIRAVESDLEDLDLGAAAAREPRGPVGADLRWSHVHEEKAKGLNKQGRMQYSSTKNDLIVVNEGSTGAEQLTLEVEAVGDTSFAMPDPPTDPLDLPAHSSMSWLLIPTPSMGTRGRTVRVKASWTEAGEPRNGEWTVALDR